METQGNQLPLNVDLSNAEDITCDSCGSLEFIESVRFKTVPGILVGKKESQMVPIQTFACAKCGHVNKQFLPNIYGEEKIKKIDEGKKPKKLELIKS